MKKRVQRAKEWCIDHAQALVVTGLTAAALAALVIAAKKEQEAQARTMQQLVDADARGATIIPTGYGQYLIVENQEVS